MSLTVGNSDFVAQQAALGEADFGLCSPTSIYDDLKYEPLVEEKFVLLMSTENALAQQESITPNHLSGERILLKERACRYRKMIESSMLERGNNPFTGIEVGSFEAIKRMVE